MLYMAFKWILEGDQLKQISLAPLHPEDKFIAPMKWERVFFGSN